MTWIARNSKKSWFLKSDELVFQQQYWWSLKCKPLADIHPYSISKCKNWRETEVVFQKYHLSPTYDSGYSSWKQVSSPTWKISLGEFFQTTEGIWRLHEVVLFQKTGI